MVSECSREMFCCGDRDVSPPVKPVQACCTLCEALILHVSLVDVSVGLLVWMEDPKEVPPLFNPAQTLENRGDFGGCIVGGISSTVNSIPISTYDSILAGI